MNEAERVAAMTKEQREAVIEGRVHDCPYNHQVGTRCPNCAEWPFAKGGAADFVNRFATILKEHERDSR